MNDPYYLCSNCAEEAPEQSVHPIEHLRVGTDGRLWCEQCWDGGVNPELWRELQKFVPDHEANIATAVREAVKKEQEEIIHLFDIWEDVADVIKAIRARK